jgi:NAD-dependent dihydropyrimidine dehydrogenase PreA subunit
MFTVLLLLVVAFSLLVLGVFWFGGERRRFHRSTWAFFHQAGVGLQALHGYVYLRWTPQYIKTLFRFTAAFSKTTRAEHWLADHYHGKVLTHDHARAVVTLNLPISRRDLEQIVPYHTARDLVLQAPPDIVAYECVCRHGRATHCEPTRVCMVIGRPFTDFILEHRPESAQRLTREEALDLLEAEHQRGHVHSAWFKDAMLNRFYAICNCCKCCCGGIWEMVERGVPMVASSGYVAQIDTDACTNCGDCVDACPFKAMTFDDGAVVRTWERCLGCGGCEVKCQVGAISMVRDQRKGMPLDVRLLA